ncbi:enoyl-CoA hydratase/isomerase family protein [Paraburkholderia xenovorans LB400]|uniref:Enoyl-CoA hydratase/isomerase n=1 Tax=Paraburkholderia xenovorans (strain LB400) TaxID=266265 RepID=Q13I52_PARXL|nr:enoyl-CoA hydratase-related protein [Paraburkholderia xenovorans]ABE36237.1 Putative enoyl-CoA hydratase/isomerase [Paraburkholderia xenovorans LB400]AIP35085.1 enoyl-CoA hydratase/isomerase family protein [Paraburkholderia xenovorans LB400]
MQSDSNPQYQHIRLEHKGPLTWLILNRPDKANALSNELLDEFSDALRWLTNNGGPVIAIRGEGRGFSSGYDLGQVGKLSSSADPVADRERLRRNVERYLAIWDHPKPIIAAVHGYCVAGATQMCVFTDMTIVAEDASIGEPTIPIGGGYIAPLWVPLVGPKRAKELAFVPGNSIDGRTAVEWGWANHAVPAGQLIQSVEDLAERIAKIAPAVLRIKKLSINRAAESMGFRDAASAVSEMDALLHMTPAVVQLKQWISEVGLKEAIAHYRVPRTTPLTVTPSADSKEQ